MKKLLLALAFLTACSGVPAPVLVANTGDKIALSINELQKAGHDLQVANVITVDQALKFQKALLAINAEVGKLPPILKAIDASPTDGTKIDQAIALLENVSASLSVVGIGLPDNVQMAKLIQAIQAGQKLVTTTMLEVAKVRK